MKKLILLSGLFFFYSLSIAQDDKRDWIWIMGYPPNLPHPEIGGTQIDFKYDPPSVNYFEINYPLTTFTVISDTNGDLQFYSNGCHVLDTTNQIMENGSPINPGYLFNVYFTTQSSSYPIGQGAIALAKPGTTNLYILFHLRSIYPNGEVLQTELLSSEINMNANNGLGKVVERNTISGDNYYSSNVSAVRHGNGRDWWIVPTDLFGLRYDAYLLTPNGVTEKMTTEIPDPNPAYAAGQIAFSPDGSWFADCNGENQIRLTRFDRCSGTFYNELKYVFPDDTVNVMGVAFSPSSNRMYVSARTRIYQFDLEAADVWASRQTVAVYDGFEYPPGFACTFFQAMLAPDNKIYLTATNGTKFLHIIHAPDSLGQSCMVQQHGLELATFHAFMVPNFPHFRLYDLQGSPCDTLGINGPVSAGKVTKPWESLELFPVPAYDQINLRFSGNLQGAVCTIVDFTGKTIRTETCNGTSDVMTFNLAGLPSGMYVMVVYTVDGRTTSKKFQILQ